ncbi:MAG: hypothetical protein J0L61_11905 [Planctomycetes bacterium]|nr:hypothetical protein [Planctomycetota bacterium]
MPMIAGFMAFLVLACAVMCVLLLKLSAQNRELREEVTRLTQALGNNGLPVGEFLPELASFGPAADPIKDAPASALKFEDGRIATVLFVHSGGCGNCDAAIAQLIPLASRFRAGGLEFVGIQTDADAPAQIKHLEANFPIRGVPGAGQSWLRRIPLVPAILIVDHEGRLRAAWYGALTPRQEQQVADEIALASKGYKPVIGGR